jgi:hypothetical protein
MTTATLTNVIQDGDTIRVFLHFSNDRDEHFNFKTDVSIAEIKTVVKTRLAEFNAVLSKVDTLKQYIGQEIK